MFQAGQNLPFLAEARMMAVAGLAGAGWTILIATSFESRRRP